jgi:hypothetical protein
LRERNDGNGVPIVPNLESAASLVALLLRHRCTMPLSANAAFMRIYECDTKVFEVPLVCGEDRQVVDNGCCGDSRVLKAGARSRRNRAIKHATGFERRCRSERESSGPIKLKDRVKPTPQVSLHLCVRVGTRRNRLLSFCLG